MEKENDTLLVLLLIVPFYLIVHLLCMGNKSAYYGIILALFRTIPIIAGVILSFSMYKKTSKTMSAMIILLSVISIWYTYDYDFLEHSGWEGFGPAFGVLLSSVFARILSIVQYGKIVGFKKTFKYLLYTLIYSIFLIAIIVVINMWVNN